MALHCPDDPFSDDEVFFGPLTLKEVKKRLFPVNTRQTIAAVSDVNTSSKSDNNVSVKIIETHSAPDIVSCTTDSPPAETRKSVSSPDLSPDIVGLNWDIKSTDDSFLKIEKIVEELYVSPRRQKVNDFNSSETIKFILKKCASIENEKGEKKELESEVSPEKFKIEANRPETLDQIQCKIPPKDTNGRNSKMPETPCSPSYYTPIKNIMKTQMGQLDNSTLNPKPLFKTPSNPVSHKKNLSVTPSKKLYQHVASPVASYIKNCPQVSLIKDVCPNKPMPGHSSIPICTKKILKTSLCNKENVKLPSIAYRTAKETKVIDVPSEHKLPKCQWARQVASSIPKAIKMKHNNRENSSTNKSLLNHQEESFADLSLHQADVSVCIQKSAKNNLK